MCPADGFGVNWRTLSRGRRMETPGTTQVRDASESPHHALVAGASPKCQSPQLRR